MLKVLLVDNLDPRTMLHGIISDIAASAHLQWEECQDADCYRRITSAADYSIVIVNTSRHDAVEIAKSVCGADREAHIIFVGGDRESSKSIEEAGVTGELGNDWSIARKDSFDLSRALANAIRSTTQRRRIRTRLHD